jgi:WD40 repeat protein
LSYAWSPQGAQLALQYNLDTNNRTLITVLDTKTLKQATFSPHESSRLIGFTPDGKSIITEIREYELVSGMHRLDFWEEVETKKGPPNEPVVALNYLKLQSVSLDLSQTQGFSKVPYVFLPDGKTFLTVGIAKDAVNPSKVNLDVQDVDATSGKTIKSLLKVTADSTSFKQLFSSNGKKLAVIEQRDTVVVYDVERATKLFVLGPSALRNRNLPAPQYPRNVPGFGGFQDTNVKLNFSANGSLLLVTRGFGSTVFNGDTGVQLPVLEGTESFIAGEPGAFSGDGRLLALVGGQYLMEKEVGKDGGPTGGKSLGSALIVWDTQTGKVLKTWNLSKQHVDITFNPVRPVLAVMEPNRNGHTRIGFWNFAAEIDDKK